MPVKNYYRTLQIDPEADSDVITVVYKQLVRKYHPDLNSSPTATAMMQQINEAYETLSDLEKREQYDKNNQVDIRSHRPYTQKRTGSKTKLTIQRDEYAESVAGIEVESCTAYYDESIIKVLGEVSSLSGRSIAQYREVHIIIYDNYGDILARKYSNWSHFGVRQSFALELRNEDPDFAPVRAKVFPTKS